MTHIFGDLTHKIEGQPPKKTKRDQLGSIHLHKYQQDIPGFRIFSFWRAWTS